MSGCPVRPRRFQKGISLSNNLLVVGKNSEQPGRSLDEEFVENPPPHRGFTANYCKVFGREEDAFRVARKFVYLCFVSIELSSVCTHKDGDPGIQVKLGTLVVTEVQQLKARDVHRLFHLKRSAEEKVWL